MIIHIFVWLPLILRFGCKVNPWHHFKNMVTVTPLMMALILNVVGLPLEGIGLVIGVGRILDMMRTSVNVYGDTCVP